MIANVAHASLTGADIHEPKGILTAATGTVYVANGAGSGSWSSGSTLLSFTGMIADFATPVVPTGWLECDGSAVARSTYSALFTAQTIQQTGTRTSGTPTITGLSATSNIAPGYYVSGTGIVVGTKVASVLGTTFTMDTNANSSGTSTITVSPWPLGDGSNTFNVPDASRRYKRSRSTGALDVTMGVLMAHQIAAHTHTASASLGGTLNSANIDHLHTVSGNTDVQSQDHTHTVTVNAGGGHTHGVSSASDSTSSFTGSPHAHTFTYNQNNTFATTGAATAITAIASSGLTAAVNTQNSTQGGSVVTSTLTNTTIAAAADHTHTASSGGQSASHTHAVNITSGGMNSNTSHTHGLGSLTATITVSATAAGTIDETRPLTIVVMTCVKT